MFLKIYFEDKPLFLCNEVDPSFESFLHHDDAIFIDELDNHSVKTMIHEMQLPQVHAGIFFHPDFDALKKAFFKKFKLIQAAGGLVLNDHKEMLLIFRRGKWDLPKGKLDAGESLDACAVREVEEETGLKDVVIRSPAFITYHTYHEGTKFILKESYWYLMHAPGKQDPEPQVAEQITETRWVNKKDVAGYYEKSYTMIKDVIEVFNC